MFLILVRKYDKTRYILFQDESLREMYRLIYFGGVERDLRADVWPYLLGFYPWRDQSVADDGGDVNERILADLREKYETLMTEWMSVEAIVRERDREAFLAGQYEKFKRENF